MIELGQKVKEKNTGVKGLVTAITEYMYGCRRICIEAEGLDKDGCITEHWFDEQRLLPPNTAKAKTGGPGPIPTKRSTPS